MAAVSLFGTPTWPPFHCFETPIWPTWRHVKTPCTFYLQSRIKVLGHFCISGAFSNSHRSNPSPHPTHNVGRVYPEFFRVSTLYRVGGGRTARKFLKGCTVLRGNRDMTEKYHDCSTVQGLLSRIIGFFFTSHSRNPAGEGPVGESRVGWLNFKMSRFRA